MNPDLPEKLPVSKAEPFHSEGSAVSGDAKAKDSEEKNENTAENWFAGVGAGMKGVSQKLLNQLPPDLREKIVEQARTHGPGSAAIAVNAAAMKTRNLKVKLALKGLGKLLQVLDSKVPRK